MSEPIIEDNKLERGLGLKEASALNMIDMVGIGPFIVIPISDSGNERTTVHDCMGGGSCASSNRWIYMGRAWSGNAQSGRKLLFSKRNLWERDMGKADVISFYLADNYSGTIG